MYRRYTNVDREGVSPNRFKQTLIRDIIIVLLLAALVVLLIMAVPNFNYQERERTLYIQRIRAELEDTTRSVNSLGSFGKTTSWQTLAEIRSNLCTIRALNDIYTTERNQSLISGEQVNTCITAVDGYIDDNSEGGRNLTILLMDLRTAMEELNNEMDRLQ